VPVCCKTAQKLWAKTKQASIVGASTLEGEKKGDDARRFRCLTIYKLATKCLNFFHTRKREKWEVLPAESKKENRRETEPKKRTR